MSCVHWVSCYTQETTLFSVIQQHIVKMFAFHIFPFPAISTPAFSTPALWCRDFHSRVFHPCITVPCFPLPRFPLLQYGAAFSTPAFSTPANSASPVYDWSHIVRRKCSYTTTHRPYAYPFTDKDQMWRGRADLRSTLSPTVQLFHDATFHVDGAKCCPACYAKICKLDLWVN